MQAVGGVTQQIGLNEDVRDGLSNLDLQSCGGEQIAGAGDQAGRRIAGFYDQASSLATYRDVPGT